MNLRPKYREYLIEEAVRKSVSVERLVELALASYQMQDRYAQDGYYPVYMNAVGEKHPLDEISGCMGDD